MTTIEKLRLIAKAQGDILLKSECDTCEQAAAELEALQKQIVDSECLAASWKGTAVHHCGNESFYRSLIVKIGEPFGIAAKTSDDGSIQEEVLALKVPELVDSLRTTVAELTTEANQEHAKAVELCDKLIEARKTIAELQKALKTIRDDFVKHGKSISNYSDGEYTQDYTTRMEIITKAIDTATSAEKK